MLGRSLLGIRILSSCFLSMPCRYTKKKVLKSLRFNRHRQTGVGVVPRQDGQHGQPWQSCRNSAKEESLHDSKVPMHFPSVHPDELVRACPQSKDALSFTSLAAALKPTWRVAIDSLRSMLRLQVALTEILGTLQLRFLVMSFPGFLSSCPKQLSHSLTNGDPGLLSTW